MLWPIPTFNYIDTLEKILFGTPLHGVFKKMFKYIKYQISKWREKTWKLIFMKNLINAPVSLDCPSLRFFVCSGILTWGNCLFSFEKGSQATLGYRPHLGKLLFLTTSTQIPSTTESHKEMVKPRVNCLRFTRYMVQLAGIKWSLCEHVCVSA